jgi:lysophospholipase L1-like esterase
LTSAFQPIVSEWAQRPNVPYVDMTATVRKQVDVSSLYPGEHSHFNKAGNHLIAAELVPVVLQLIASSRSPTP